MSLAVQNRTVNFGPYRAILRALFLKAPDVAKSFCDSFNLDRSQILSSEVHVPQKNMETLWAHVQDIQKSQPLLLLEAASLFQWSDLGDRGWVLITAHNISTALSFFQEHFSELHIEVENVDAFALCRCFASKTTPTIMFIYFGTIFLNYLISQGVRLSATENLTLPKFSAPGDTQVETLVKERLLTDYQATISFAGDALMFRLKHETLFTVLKTADESLFQFFLHRSVKIKTKASHEFSSNTNSKLVQQIRQILLRNLSSSQFDSKNISEELGYSIRTLERILAQYHLTIRSLKQEVQREAAEEMLSMGMRAKEVAAKIGFEDVAAFSRAFHKWTGTPPSQFRKKKQDE